MTDKLLGLDEDVKCISPTGDRREIGAKPSGFIADGSDSRFAR